MKWRILLVYVQILTTPHLYNCLRCPAHHGPAMGPCKEEFGWTYMQGRFDTVYKWEYLRTEIEAPILGSFLSNMSVQKKNSPNSSHFELSICHDGYCILIKLYSSSGIRSFCKKNIITWISISHHIPIFQKKSTLVGFPHEPPLAARCPGPLAE